MADNIRGEAKDGADPDVALYEPISFKPDDSNREYSRIDIATVNTENVYVKAASKTEDQNAIKSKVLFYFVAIILVGVVILTVISASLPCFLKLQVLSQKSNLFSRCKHQMNLL